MVHEDGRLLALLPANREGVGVVSHGGLTFGGFITDHRMTIVRMLETFSLTIACLRNEGIREWTYKPVPHIYHHGPAEEDLYALFRNGARLIRREVASSIRIASPRQYSKGRKADVKKGRERNLDIAGGSDFEQFMSLTEAVLRTRHGAAPVHTAGELASLAASFPDSIKLITASVEGEILAGVVLYLTQQVAHTQYIAVSDKGKDVHALDALMADLIDKCDRPWFDFGTSTLEGGRVLNETLARNKESWGARAITYDWYTVDVR